MAKLELAVGPITSSETFPDAKAQTTLLAYGRRRNLGGEVAFDTLAAQVQLDLIRDDLIDHIVSTVTNPEIQERSSLSAEAIRNQVEIELDFRDRG